MKVGTDISVLAEEGRSDAAVLADHLKSADLAEPLGFDSLRSRASLYGLLDVTPPAAALELLRRQDKADHARHLRHRPAVARPDPRGRTDRVS